MRFSLQALSDGERILLWLAGAGGGLFILTLTVLAREVLWTFISRLSRVLAWIGGALMLTAALIVTAEVLVRKALPLAVSTLIDVDGWIGAPLAGPLKRLSDAVPGMTFSGSDEIAGYLFAIGASFALAFALVSRGHVRIDALYGTLPRGVRAVLDIVALMALAVLVVAMVDRGYALWHDNVESWTRSNTNLRIPLAIPQAFWLIGMLVFLLAIMVAFVRSLAGIVTGDLAKVAETIGIPSQQDEIKSELEGLGIQTPGREKS